METEHYHDRKQRIKLRIVTNIGINLLCTCMKSWKVAEFLPHIQKAYDEVIEDQVGSKPVKVIRIKKDNFYIANSETVGDVFDDNEEVFCELMEKEGKTKKKLEKRKTKEIQERQERQQQKQVTEVIQKHAEKKNKHGEIQKNHEENIQKQVKPQKTEKNSKYVERQEQSERSKQERPKQERSKQEKKEKHFKKQENYAQKHKKHSQQPSKEGEVSLAEKQTLKHNSDRSLIASKAATIKSILSQKMTKQESSVISKKEEKSANKLHIMPSKLDISELARRIKGKSDLVEAKPDRKIVKIREDSDQSDQ